MSIATGSAECVANLDPHSSALGPGPGPGRSVGSPTGTAKPEDAQASRGTIHGIVSTRRGNARYARTLLCPDAESGLVLALAGMRVNRRTRLRGLDV